MISTRTWTLGISLALCLGPLFLWSGARSGAATADLIPEAHAVDAAREIDRLVQLDLKDFGLSPEPLADDDTFMRRVYLDLIGRIPNAPEAREFMDSKDPAKRAKIIDSLLASPGRVSRDFNWWSDLLRVKTRSSNQISGEPYIDWLKKSLIANKAYDQMVREMLTAEGSANSRDNGATGYLLRDFNMPHDNMANTMRVFLGTRIECAQCHNHPFESWTQRQFFEMAAFQGGIRYRSNEMNPAEMRELLSTMRRIRTEQGEDVYQYLRRSVQQVVAFGISGNGSGLENLPKDYKYEDAEPGSFVTARSLLGQDIAMDVDEPRPIPRRNRRQGAQQRNRLGPSPQNDSRNVFADWLTSPENPRFTTVIVNRVWSKLMGRGLIEPVDDIKESTVADNPELLSYLEGLLIDLDYDLLAFEKSILLSQTYQREAVSHDIAPGESFHFEGPIIRRLSAEQMWDSLLTLVIKDLDTTIVMGTSLRAEQLYKSYESSTSKSIQEIVAEAERMGEKGLTARQMANSRANGTRQAVRDQLRELTKARRQGDDKLVGEIEEKLESMGVDLDRMNIQRRYGNEMLRASELRQPTPPGHFLRDFGQSDREQIDASQDDASVPQVLNLLNGFVEDNLLPQKQGTLVSSIRNAKDPDQKVRNAFITILSRRPSKAEIAMWRDEARRGGDEVWNDLIWTLVNSHEFRFQR